VIAAALLLPFPAIQSQSTVGPFAIESMRFREETSPYPRNRNVTLLQWKSPSGLTVYNLSDDGEYVVASFKVEGQGGWCQSSPAPIRLTARPSMRFDIDCKLLDSARSSRLASEMRAARPYFAAAYARFYDATLRQHGSDLQRCRETDFGNHGTVCVRYWDERRAATDQPKNKRIP
jgi:hypothetical protein